MKSKTKDCILAICVSAIVLLLTLGHWWISSPMHLDGSPRVKRDITLLYVTCVFGNGYTSMEQVHAILGKPHDIYAGGITLEIYYTIDGHAVSFNREFDAAKGGRFVVAPK